MMMIALLVNLSSKSLALCPAPLRGSRMSVRTLPSSQSLWSRSLSCRTIPTCIIGPTGTRISTTSRIGCPRPTSTSLRLSSSIPPTVEISPSDHGTKAIDHFDSSFDDRLVKTLKQEKWTTPTIIQANAIPLLQRSYDVMASSQTGSGKSIMFCLPLLQTILTDAMSKSSNSRSGNSSPAALIISPTRELAIQTSTVLKTLCRHVPNLKVSLATGGASLKEQRQGLYNTDILVGTPGRILQFADERQLSLRSLKYLVIDEADRLLDLGFEPQLTRISRLVQRNKEISHQSVLCSATFPAGVQRIAADFLRPDYYFVSVGRVGSTHDRIRQRFEWAASPGAKEQAVVGNVRDFLQSTTSEKKNAQTSVVVFSNTKEDVERYGKALSKLKNTKCRVIHGDKLQSERNKALADFKNQKAQILVATDVAARGLDITSIGLVVQADAPRDSDTYTHRVGRTGRAGASGDAVTLLDGRSMGIASNLVELMEDARQSEETPAWLIGMSYVHRARALEEERQITAGSGTPDSSSSSVVDFSDLEVTNEQFTGQDFRRTAVVGSYGAGRDTSYRSFDDEAYSNDVPTEDNSLDETITSTESILKLEDGISSEYQGSKPGEATDNGLEEVSATASVPFHRKNPSRKLLESVSRISGKDEIGDQPDKKVLDGLSRGGGGANQRLRFEYLGMFPFDLVLPLLSSDKSSDNDSVGDQLPRILMVAEKPSIAKAIADALSGRRGPRQRRGISRALPVYEFTSNNFIPLNSENGSPTRCVVTVTSVVGHIFSLGFDNQNQTKTDPSDFFRLPVVKQEEGTTSKLRVVDHLRALAGASDHLVLWLDCDPEGENIAHEVIAVTRRAIETQEAQGDEAKKIHRARFSAITHSALQDAFSKLEEPDAALSRSVDARQELDLRIGVALTRLLTWKCVGLARKNFSPATRLVSYGPCQTPALSFCVDRAREIETFKSKAYYKVILEARVPGKKSFPLSWRVPKDEEVMDVRNTRKGRTVTPNSSEDNATFLKASADEVVRRASSANAGVVVVGIQEKTETIPPPLGLNTVALLEAGSKAMGMSPKQVMNVAEKLYSAGFISYPRTETTRYDPNGFDVRSTLREHTKHEAWGRSAAYLLRTKYSKSGRPPLRGRDVGDHPPITPLKAATRGEVGGGAAWRVYEHVVRNFLGSLHNELSFTRRVASLSLEGETQPQFDVEFVSVDSLGFADCCRWVLNDIGASGRKEDKMNLEMGQRFSISKAAVESAKTRPPRFLQEHELILLMDENRIGTDASMAVHVTNIIDRGYVILCDETGVPIRPYRPPRPGQQPRPRQIGRYMVPTALGRSLLNLFGDDYGEMSPTGEIASPARLVQPAIRRQMEEEVKEIALGNFDKDFCLEKNLDWFESRYQELAHSLSRDRINGFGRSLCPTNVSLRYWTKLEAFEPKGSNAPKMPRKKTNKQNKNARHSNSPSHGKQKGGAKRDIKNGPKGSSGTRKGYRKKTKGKTKVKGAR